jgi:hypothetical protein
MEAKDLDDLEEAVHLLETPGLLIRLTNLLAYPIEGVMRVLPKWVGRAIGKMAAGAVGTALCYALATMDRGCRRRPFPGIHQMLVLFSGAAGGFFGFPGLLVELPFSTTVMLRSIADIARAEGEDLSSSDAQLACVTVFALGGRSRSDDAGETAYYAIRAALTRAVSEAAEFIAQRGIVEEGTPLLVRVMANVASRFGVILTDKMAAEMVPVLGAIGGAAINLLFIRHFQASARGHFIVRRLERTYGAEPVKKEYEKFADKLGKGPRRENG